MMRKIFLSLLLSTTTLSFGEESGPLSSLYISLDPLSIVQNLAFYELYPTSPEGNKALHRAWNLLAADSPLSASPLILPKLDVQAIVSLTTRQPSDPPSNLSEEQLAIMKKIGGSLQNRKLQGSLVWEEQEILALPEEEIDLARSLLIYQFADDPDKKNKILQYEATLDLMALQIKARLPNNHTPLDLIEQISVFIFQEMGFRYPPHSLDIKDIDLYTFLPSVMDSRRGVCLGVSILYLSLAQRLNLTLEIITPPGHIYLRYPTGNGVINIETTARGINLPSEVYLGINTRSLQLRNIKEVIGLSFINEASIYLGKGNYSKTALLYERASLYLPEDPLLKMLLGINYLFLDKKKEGKKLLTSLSPFTFDHAVSPETMPIDYIKGNTDIEGLKAVFLSVDENRSSILKKQEALLASLKKYPKFRAGLIQLATTYLQLGKAGDAFDVLLKYHEVDPNDATVEYYLSILSLERLDYPRSREFLENLSTLLKNREHSPKILRSLKTALQRVSPNINFKGD